MFFHIQYRGQLRRTRPELIVSLEDMVSASASAAGGIVETGRKILEATFDEDRIGFWLDLVVFLEKVYSALLKAMPELYGYALVLGRDATEPLARKLCRFNSERNSREATGIWFSPGILGALEFYIIYNRSMGIKGKDLRPLGPYNEDKYPQKASQAPVGVPEGYIELKDFRSFESDGSNYPRRKKIMQAMEGNENTLLLGSDFVDIKDGIHRFCAGLRGRVPPLIISFGALGLECFVDAYTPGIRSFIAIASSGEKEKETLEELDALHALLFRERLRDEWSPGMIEKGSAFISSLLSAYVTAVRTQRYRGVLILEDLSQADDSGKIFINAFSSLPNREKLLVFGSSEEEDLKGWENVFGRIVKIAPDDSAPRKIQADDPLWRSIPVDLLEISSSITILGRYFPVYLFPDLFEEEGLNRDVYYRALKILSALGVTSAENPILFIPGFESCSKRVLGKRMEKVRSTVRRRLLSWVLSGRLRSCFNLLRILSGLGEKIEDAFILKSIKADVFNGTWKGIEKAIDEGYFASVVGEDNSAKTGNVQLLLYIYKTFRALVWGGSTEIRKAFQEPVPPAKMADGSPCYTGCLAQVQANLAAFHIGRRNVDAASEAVRSAMLLNRDLGENAVPAYRLFALVNLSRQRIDDAMEYISFALEQAEKTGQQDEVFLTCYFASSINLLHGNLSRAMRLALKAEETALRLGQKNWGMRARLLRGRLFFEIGRYGDALEVFESITSEINQTLSAIPDSIESNMARTVEAWIFRTKNFLGRFSIMKENAGSDAGIFKIEAAYFTSDYKEAEVLASDFLSSSHQYNFAGFNSEEYNFEDFIFTERPDWQSGFSQCEYMFQPEKVPGTKLVQVYRAMAQCAMHPAYEVRAEILSGMQRFMRDEILPDTDPNDVVYFYAWLCMLRDSKNPKDNLASQVDLNTVVSMAFKRLQRRAGRIDDKETRQAFLSLPRRNNAIFQAAREYKLI